jgi:hypothetical protein
MGYWYGWGETLEQAMRIAHQQAQMDGVRQRVTLRQVHNPLPFGNPTGRAWFVEPLKDQPIDDGQAAAPHA